MTLYIDTASNDFIILGLKSGVNFVLKKKISAHRQQSEKLIKNIDKILALKKIAPSKIRAIEVVNEGDSFTALRIGVITANTLAYAWGLPVLPTNKKGLKSKNKINLAIPIYSREPEIGQKKI